MECTRHGRAYAWKIQGMGSPEVGRYQLLVFWARKVTDIEALAINILGMVGHALERYKPWEALYLEVTKHGGTRL